MILLLSRMLLITVISLQMSISDRQRILILPNVITLYRSELLTAVICSGEYMTEAATESITLRSMLTNWIVNSSACLEDWAV